MSNEPLEKLAEKAAHFFSRIPNREEKSNQKIKFFIAFLLSLTGFIFCYLYFKDLFDSKDPLISFLNELIKIIFSPNAECVYSITVQSIFCPNILLKYSFDCLFLK